MKTYEYCTDAVAGEVEASSMEEALALVRAEEKITDAEFADGAWIYIQDPETGETLQVGSDR